MPAHVTAPIHIITSWATRNNYWYNTNCAACLEAQLVALPPTPYARVACGCGEMDGCVAMSCYVARHFLSVGVEVQRRSRSAWSDAHFSKVTSPEVTPTITVAGTLLWLYMYTLSMRLARAHDMLPLAIAVPSVM